MNYQLHQQVVTNGGANVKQKKLISQNQGSLVSKMFSHALRQPANGMQPAFWQPFRRSNPRMFAQRLPPGKSASCDKMLIQSSWPY
jgi:hypothetical protein